MFMVNVRTYVKKFLNRVGLIILIRWEIKLGADVPQFVVFMIIVIIFVLMRIQPQFFTTLNVVHYTIIKIVLENGNVIAVVVVDIVEQRKNIVVPVVKKNMGRVGSGKF